MTHHNLKRYPSLEYPLLVIPEANSICTIKHMYCSLERVCCNRFLYNIMFNGILITLDQDVNVRSGTLWPILIKMNYQIYGLISIYCKTQQHIIIYRPLAAIASHIKRQSQKTLYNIIYIYPGQGMITIVDEIFNKSFVKWLWIQRILFDPRKQFRFILYGLLPPE